MRAGRVAGSRLHRRPGLVAGAALALLGARVGPAAAQSVPPAGDVPPPAGDAVEVAPVPAGPPPARAEAAQLGDVVLTVTTDMAGELALAIAEAEQDGYFWAVNRSGGEVRVVITRAERVLLDTALLRDGTLVWLPPERL